MNCTWSAASPVLPRGGDAVRPASLAAAAAPAWPLGEAGGTVPCLGDARVPPILLGDPWIPPAPALERGSGGPDERTRGGEGDLHRLPGKDWSIALGRKVLCYAMPCHAMLSVSALVNASVAQLWWLKVPCLLVLSAMLPAGGGVRHRPCYKQLHVRSERSSGLNLHAEIKVFRQCTSCC